jgi:hypothetical protein
MTSRRIAPTPPRGAVANCVPASSASSIDAPASSRWMLARLHANKPELLMVLDRPEIPLHTNGSERDIRLHVTRRKVSGGTRSVDGRDCRDVFLGLMRTAAKLGIAFWDYLGDRFRHSWSADHSISAGPDPRSRTARLSRTARGFAPVTRFYPLRCVSPLERQLLHLDTLS